MNPNHQEISRREFVRDTAAQAVGLSVASSVVAGACNIVPAGAAEVPAEIKQTRSYNSQMEYRRLGKTGLWVSAVCLGGHWKRIDKVIAADGPLDATNAPREELMGPFMKNRYDVVSRCIEQGINMIDLAGDSEPEVYYKVLEGRRDAMYLAYSHPRSELRPPENRRADKLLELFKAGLKRCQVEYADIWRLMALERGGRHSEADVEAMITALDKARQQGLCRFTGFSTHDRRWAKMLMETYPDIVQVICIPYTSNTKVLPEDSMLDAALKWDVGILGIKPFASNSLFKGDGSPDGPHVEDDNRIARMALRYILENPAITAPIPGLISLAQVDNAARAVRERRELDTAERAELKQASERAWACLPGNYQWLKDWEYV
ncbi:MAG: aldo/keto reductase [Planctomycetaceae bacterium]|nr:MAG: aldo/keto reductase [Planctomycetaceae bacterium]